MAYTASALSFMLENLGKSVVITGSQVKQFYLQKRVVISKKYFDCKPIYYKLLHIENMLNFYVNESNLKNHYLFQMFEKHTV